MTLYRFTELAAQDLSEIWTFIATENPDAADRVAVAIYAACDVLADNPEAGQEREDLTSLPVRFWLLQPYRNYWIVYDPAAKPIEITESCTAHVRFLQFSSERHSATKL